MGAATLTGSLFSNTAPGARGDGTPVRMVVADGTAPPRAAPEEAPLAVVGHLALFGALTAASRHRSGRRRS